MTTGDGGDAPCCSCLHRPVERFADAWYKVPEWKTLLLNALLSTSAGVVLGLSTPPEAPIPSPWREISNVTGWIYFVSWSAALYPAPVMTWVRGTADGLSIESRLITLLGYAAYSTYNGMLLYNASTRAEYMRVQGSPPEVRTNDLLYALHGAALSLIVLGEMFYFSKRESTLALGATGWHRLAILIFACMLVFVLILVGLVVTSSITLLRFAGLLANVELASNTVKYIPQLLLNYERKRTLGVFTVALRFQGALLSVVQMFIDCYAAQPTDWSGVIGDPVKFSLGFSSLFFDIIFFMQHYYFYANQADKGLELGNARHPAIEEPLGQSEMTPLVRRSREGT